MEPVTTSSGKIGSIDNPEVYDNTPGHIIPIIEKEFDDFETEALKFLDGEIEEANYIGFRLKQGVYGQRQPGVNMTRVKLPWGGVTPDQLDAFGDVSEKYAPLKKGHITTRQAIQIHHIPLANMHLLLRDLSLAGLSSREGCGNTVRNVTGDPYAGILEGEVFDPTPWAGAFVRYFVRNELTQLLPRKCKVAFSGYPDNRALTDIHDIAFEAVVNDKGEQGFKMLVGGGTSIFPRLAPTLSEFVPFNEFLKYSEAVLRIFNRCDELRVNRARARIKVYIDRIGMDQFRAEVLEEMKGDWVNQRNFDPTNLLYIDDEEASAPDVPVNAASPNGDLTEYENWAEHNVVPQRQDGFSAITVKITRGDLTPAQWHGLADISREYASGRARTTQTQNLVLRWVRNESVYEVWKKLVALGLGKPGADTITDVVTCPGTDSCKMGITSSMGLNKALEERLEQLDFQDPTTKKTVIRASGCPNGCSQHHIASIGLNGASMKFDGKQVPAYLVQIGGRGTEGKVNFGFRLKVRLPAKRTPDAIERWLKFYESDRNEGEEFSDFADRVGAEPFETMVKDLSLPVEFNEETKGTFMDWERNSLYIVERGEGECAV